MLFEDYFFHLFYHAGHPHDTKPDWIFEYFLDNFLHLLHYHNFTQEDSISQLLNAKFCETTWGLANAFLIPREEIHLLPTLYRYQYTQKTITINGKDYFAYLAWSDLQVTKAHTWYIKTFARGFANYYCQRAIVFAFLSQKYSYNKSCFYKDQKAYCESIRNVEDEEAQTEQSERESQNEEMKIDR